MQIFLRFYFFASKRFTKLPKENGLLSGVGTQIPTYCVLATT